MTTTVVVPLSFSRSERGYGVMVPQRILLLFEMSNALWHRCVMVRLLPMTKSYYYCRPCFTRPVNHRTLCVLITLFDRAPNHAKLHPLIAVADPVRGLLFAQYRQTLC